MKLIDKLLRRSPSVVAIGGGTGLATLLRGLKVHTDKILAVCTVADDGGSSGRLRKDFNILPPGDIRNCLVALSNTSPIIEELFQYRFSESDLKGHNAGNILLAALTRITGDFYSAVQEANKLLNVRGRVLPATLTKVALVAHHSDGSKSTGESLIGQGGGRSGERGGVRAATKRIERISLKPEPEAASQEILDGIAQADLILLGPGSLYTSVIPNLLIKGILPALAESSAIKGYVCNVMTQPGETPGYTAADHIEALMRHATPGLLDFAVLNAGTVSEKMRLKYEQEGAEVVRIDDARLEKLGGKFKIASVDLVNSDNVVRHDSAKLADVVLATYRELLKERSKQRKAASGDA